MENKPWLEKRFNTWEVNTTEKIIVNCCANQEIIIDKLFGPLAAFNVRIRLEYNNDKSDWVVERQRPINKDDPGSDMEWIEMARWDCQLDWWKDNE